MKTLYLDCYSGISGDMTVGALIDAGADFERIRVGLESLNVDGFSVEAPKVIKKGIFATQFKVIEHKHEHVHRHLRHCVEIINKGLLPQPVKQAACETFELIAEAEAQVHGTTKEKIHFHEVGAIDSIVDIVAAQLGLYLLGVEQVISSALHVGSGTVRCAHGVMPVPAPATALLLKEIPTYSTKVDGELVTPTGAALVKHRAKSYGPMPPMTVKAIGYGAGTKDLPDRANVLRVLIGETADSVVENIENITIIEANLDDMTGELFPPLVQALLSAGARDAFLTPVLGKKGRPAHIVTALCEDAKLQTVLHALFTNSTTLGVRTRQEKRFVLPRATKRVSTPYGEVRVKIGTFNEHTNSRAPEYEDCAECALAAKVPVRVVYEAALAAALKDEFLS